MEMEEALLRVSGGPVAMETADGAALSAAERRRQQHYALIVIGQISEVHQLWKAKEHIKQGESISQIWSFNRMHFV